MESLTWGAAEAAWGRGLHPSMPTSPWSILLRRAWCSSGTKAAC